MDRNLGAITNAYVASYLRGCFMVYQYGRKDPFEGNIPIYKIDGTAIATSATAGFAAQLWNQANANITTRPTGVTLPYFVQNPMRFCQSSGDWGQMNENAYLWYDSKVSTNNRTGKSIYDPCPPGWAVAVYGYLDDFQNNKTTNNASRGLAWNSGLVYWPYYNPGNGTYPVGGSIRYIAQGLRMGTTAVFANSGADNDYSTATTVSVSQSYNLNSSPNVTQTNEINSKANGFAVRCISQSPQP